MQSKFFWYWSNIMSSILGGSPRNCQIRASSDATG
jgi:hypothetical protein